MPVTISDPPMSSLSDKHPPQGVDDALLLVPGKVAAQLVSVSLPTWTRMDAAGKVPSPVRLSKGCVRWRVSDLRLWVDLKCPPRSEFEA